jgi:transcriptional regulator with XRE-family HTH domain
MHHFPYPSYLRTHRKRWSLSQAELGMLLDISKGLISKYETLNREPSAAVLIGTEFIFGEAARHLFPAFYASIELDITTRAALFAESLVGNTSKKALVKRELLEAIARRAASDNSTL